MEITIKGELKEISALVLAVQERQDTARVDEITDRIQAVLDGMP